MKGGHFGENIRDFSKSILPQNIKKLKGKPFGKNVFQKKSHSAKKTERVDPLVSPSTVRYAEKEENPFWFSSLGQMIQFGIIKLRRTFKNYFGQFVSSCGLEKNEKKESL